MAAAFSKSLKSSILYKIAPHQIASLCSDESDIIFAMVLKGTHIFSTVFGLILYLIAGILLLGPPGMWPLIGIFGLFIGAVSHVKNQLKTFI